RVKVSSTELPPRQVSLAIEVEQERLDRAMDDAFRRLAGRVDVPGFRRGKAPRSMVERMIGRERIVEEALDRLVPEVVTEAIEQEKVEPFTRPRVESIEFDPLRLKAVVGLAPKVELGNYRGDLRVAPEEASVEAEQVDSVIQRLRDSYAQWAPVERPVKLGDRVGLDLHAVVGGRDNALLDSKEAEYVVDPEGAQPAPGFAEQLSGLSPGDQKSFTLNMPEDYADKEVAGQPAEFSITLHWVKERELPELDADFVQQVGEYTDVAGLRAAIETQLREREEARVREKLEETVMSKLVEISTIEFPPQLIDHQAQHMLETFTRNVEQQGLQLPQYLRLVGKEQETFEQELRVQAETQVRRSLALDAFADAEQIGVEPQEVEEEVRRAAAGTAEANAVERLALANPSTMQRVQEATRERKAMARLLELAIADGQTTTAQSTTRPEKAAAPAATTDTEGESRAAEVAATAVAEEDPGNT
ncbi:MAG: trigger factor, partial [Chloroflexi bacterium]|nr:trigger factor [Chloroflexota bacterium]